MTKQSPCADRRNDPQDWFIRSDGKQYPDEDLLTADERHRISLSVLRIEGEGSGEHEIRRLAALSAARNTRRREMLARRRKAKDLCWSACPIRVECGAQALERVERHGTWGGFLEEELAEMHAENARRARRTGPRLF